ncbi:MAG: LacI family DNA-binding transcriptional regulator [Petrimonas sp.]|nr:LacI family DNA-binding transcriptional regulator [Petrimonas sp.]
MERVSLKMIANELGVSIATVSLVLNGKNKNGRVSQGMSQKIIDKAAELNYVPNNFAKSLKMGRSKTIGLIVADISNVFFGSLALHIQICAEKAGYTVFIGNTNEKLIEMEKMIKLFKARQVDGLIITPTEGSEKLIKDLLKADIPFVLVDRSFPELDVDSVLINNYQISNVSTKHLLKKGCRNIAFVTYKQDQFHINERKRGYMEAMKEVGLFNPENVKEVRYGFLEKDIRKAISQIMKSEKKIDGIFFATNSISLAGVKSLFNYKIELQKDIQIMCFDESEAFYLLPFSVPFVKQPIEEMGKQAVRSLLSQVERHANEERHVILNAALINK